MIPKIIHYTWFSGEPYPDLIKRCIDSWHKYMPDWEFRLWDMDAIQDIDSVFLKEAISMRKWAFAADFVRLWAVVNYGGVYLDTDVLVYKPFDDLLTQPAFIGKENSWHITGRRTEVYLTAHCFGAMSHNAYFERCLDYYIDRHFITSPLQSLPMTLRCDMTIAPYIYSEIAKTLGYNASALSKGTAEQLADVRIFPASSFDALGVNADTYCQHLAMGAWREQKSQEPTYNLSYKIKWRLWHVVKKALAHFNREVIEIN